MRWAELPVGAVQRDDHDPVHLHGHRCAVCGLAQHDRRGRARRPRSTGRRLGPRRRTASEHDASEQDRDRNVDPRWGADGCISTSAEGRAVILRRCARWPGRPDSRRHRLRPTSVASGRGRELVRVVPWRRPKMEQGTRAPSRGLQASDVRSPERRRPERRFGRRGSVEHTRVSRVVGSGESDRGKAACSAPAGADVFDLEFDPVTRRCTAHEDRPPVCPGLSPQLATNRRPRIGYRSGAPTGWISPGRNGPRA